MLDHTHDSQATSWVPSAQASNCPFPIQNLPFARWHYQDKLRAVVAIGDRVLDLSHLDLPISSLREGSLVGLADVHQRRALRHQLFQWLCEPQPQLESHLYPISEGRFELPFEVGDYTDFYASRHHATRVGSMFRPDNPLLPNYDWVPIGYHGRSSSLLVSGTPVVRPSGQLKADSEDSPSFGPCKMLDYELELGIWVGAGNPPGNPIPISQVKQHWIGVSLVNDWSARDIQRWEYQPLGPFLAKSFATSVSPWVITQEALAPYFVGAAPHQPQPLDYLWDEDDQKQGALDLQLEVWLAPEGSEFQQLSHSNTRDLFWTPGQLLAHHASNGCPMCTGDLLASGTVSGPTQEEAGCLLELTWAGAGQPRQPVSLGNGQTRTFLQDGDLLELRGWARRPGYASIGLGECSGRVGAGPTR
jgi:fumarylacetoacetase